MNPQAFASALSALDLFSVVVFAVTGALVASRKEMDVFGFSLLGTVTGVGGGSIRDVLMGETPVFWVKEPIYILLCVAASVLVFFTAHIPESRYRVLLWLDCVGLSLVSVLGAEKALSAGAGPTVAIVMGVVTGTFGGILRDILGAESPLVLRKEIYVTAALFGASIYVGATWFGIDKLLATLIGFAGCFIVRGLAIKYRWSLPPYRARPGRGPDELNKMGM